MKLKHMLYISILLFISCKLQKVLYKRQVNDAVVLLSFERAINEDRYILKSEKIMVGNQEYDLLSWVPTKSEIELLLQKRGVNTQVDSSNMCFTIEEGDEFVSDHIYYWLNDEDDLSIIFSFKGDITIINKLPLDRKYGNFHYYSCPVFIDTLNVPYCKIIAIDSCYTISPEWVNKSLYIKTTKNRFKARFCD